MPKPIALQLYSLREEAKRDFPKVLETAAGIGYAGVEFAGLHGLRPREVRRLLDGLGLRACGAHLNVFNPAETQKVIEEAGELGLTCVGGGCGAKNFETEAALRAAAEQARAAVERLGAAGLKVYYHNHWWEWDAPGKGELFLQLTAPLLVQFDIYWLQTAGRDPAQLIRQYADRALLLHVKDGPCVRNQPMTAVGRGRVAIQAAVEAAEGSLCEWLIVELDSCATDVLQAVKESYDYLVGRGLASGRA